MLRKIAIGRAPAPPAVRRRWLSSIGALKQAQDRWGNKLVISPEIEHSISSGDRVPIALESAIITHGMPHPANLTTTQSLMSILSTHPSAKVVAAPIAILDSNVHVGLSPAQLERLSNPPSTDRRALKISRRDLPYALSRTGDERVSGGTTVAGTMIIARSLGIDLFVTGGIGGVHRGASKSMDVSADLQELSRTPMGVICAGAKSILDIGLTLEVLETLGVNVTTFGETDDFPAFYSSTSGFKSPYSVESAAAAASLLHTSLTLPSPMSTLFAVPIPAEHHAAGASIQRAVEQAVAESEENGMVKRGKEVTPWLLKRVGELTGGRALQSNIALIENNARVGADIAAELWSIRNASDSRSSHHMPSFTVVNPDAASVRSTTSPTRTQLPPPKVLVFGSAAVDITARASGKDSTVAILGSTAQGVVSLSPGGVGRNIAEAATRLLDPDQIMLVSVLGGVAAASEEPERLDAWREILRDDMRSKGMRTDGLITRPASKSREARRTAVCNLTLNEDADLAAGVADMEIVETLIEQEVKARMVSAPGSMIVVDGNVSADVLSALVDHRKSSDSEILFEPTSLAKVGRILPSMQVSAGADRGGLVDHFTPNILELASLHQQAALAGLVNQLGVLTSRDTSENVSAQASALLPWFRNIWVKMGAAGVLRFSADTNKGKANPAESYSYKTWVVPANNATATAVRAEHYNAAYVDPADIVSTTGAGDSFVGGLVAALAVRGKKPLRKEDIAMALECAAASLLSSEAVSTKLKEVRRKWRG